ncbi:adenosylcobinamide amidohydrolase [Haloferacaceae archaeon DSL9]
MSEPVFRPTVREGVLQARRPDTVWLSTGYDGGTRRGDAAYNMTVPEGWPETDLDAYIADRLARADFDATGPALLTGVDLEHARRARLGPVEAIATAGVSNPAALPMWDADEPTSSDSSHPAVADSAVDERLGTVNVVVGTVRSLPPGALANLVAVAAEAKAATLLAATGFTGTTTDAIAVGTDPSGEAAPFSGSATAVGAATRACVREAVRASIDSRYAETPLPSSVADAAYGVVTDERASVSRL